MTILDPSEKLSYLKKEIKEACLKLWNLKGEMDKIEKETTKLEIKSKGLVNKIKEDEVIIKWLEVSIIKLTDIHKWREQELAQKLEVNENTLKDIEKEMVVKKEHNKKVKKSEKMVDDIEKEHKEFKEDIKVIEKAIMEKVVNVWRKDEILKKRELNLKVFKEDLENMKEFRFSSCSSWAAP